jgi:uncharacterized SAM-binding protein YcdF (DUF218 family)
LIKKHWRRLTIGFVLLAVVWVLAWVAARCLIVSAPLNRADAIVVLSGSSTLTERVQHAARLYSEQRSQRIILTTDNRQGGWSSAEQRNPYFHEIAVNELIRLGVPSADMEVIRPPVDSTWDEALLVSQYAKTHNLRSILIVTSSYHSRRALWTFRTLLRDGSTEVGVDPVATGIQTPAPTTWWLHRKGWQLVLVEYLKLIYYRLAVLK